MLKLCGGTMMQTQDIYRNHFLDHFNPINLEKLEANLLVLKGIEPEKQILSGPDNSLLADNRWVRSAAVLDTKSLDWTMRNIFVLIGLWGKISDRDAELHPHLDLIGRLHFMARVYFRKLKILEKTYAKLPDGLLISNQISDIRKIYKHKILLVIETNFPQFKKKPIPEITDATDTTINGEDDAGIALLE